MDMRTQGTAMKTILIVEDDTAIGEVLIQVLSQETPHQSVLVPNGFQALDIVRKLIPDLLLLDYRLPGMNGLELYDRLHATKGPEHIPTIMLSAYLPQREIKQRKIVGMHKPFELDILLDKIEELLSATMKR
jgi:CheY-like chemotaxis protein